MAEKYEYAPWTWEPPEGGCIGQRGLTRKDGYEKASGKAMYTSDISVPGMLYAKILRSPYAQAKIINMDTSKVEALPGVRHILRYDDPDISKEYNISMEGNYWKPALAGISDHYDDPMGIIVVADSEEICDQALKLLDIEWEEQPFILDMEEAAQPDAPKILTTNLPPCEVGNIHLIQTQEYGDVESGFMEADKVVQCTIRREENVNAGVENIVAVARWRGDYLETWIRHQNPGHVRQSFSTKDPYSNHDFRLANIHINDPYQGAWFGGVTWLPYSRLFPRIAAILAKRVQRPVKLLYDESHFYCRGDEEGTYNFKVGFKNDGTITAISIDGYSMRSTISKIRSGTKIPNLKTDTIWSWTNRAPFQCYRHGNVTSLCQNVPFTRVAAELDMDPTEVALINDGNNGQDLDYTTNHQIETGHPVRQSLKECIDWGKEAIDWDNKWHSPGTKKLANGKMHGLGFTHVIEWSTRCGNTWIGARLNEDKVQVLGMLSDIGVNSASAYSQIVASEVGVKYGDVVFRHFGYTGGFEHKAPAGSSGSVGSTPALVLVSRKLKEQLLGLCSQPYTTGGFGTGKPTTPMPAMFPDKTPEELDIRDSEIFEKANPDNKVPILTLGNAFSGQYDTLTATVQAPRLSEPREQLVMCKQAHFIEVEVDTETGKVDITRAALVNDVGTAMNLDSLNGQQYGGIVMGIGKSLTEEKVIDPQTGVWLNSNLIGHSILTMLDIPPVCDCHIVETKGAWAAYGLSGIGENIAAATCAITGNAIYNAIGKWVDTFPNTPARVLQALGKG